MAGAEMGNAIRVSGLRKSYGGFEAVKGISFDVEEGSFFAFLGPNGAGKSTTISILCSILSKDSGEVEIFGRSPEESRRDIGVVFQDNRLDERLTVRENLAVRGSLYGYGKAELSRRVEDALEKTGSTDIADRFYSDLSGGQKRRVEIARGIIHSPRILMLDEPTSGLDPQTRKLIWKNIRRLRDEGMTVFLTTHYMEEAADADDVVVIDHGEVAAHGTPSMLKERYSSDYLDVVPRDRDGLEAMLERMGVGYTEHSDMVRIPLKDTMDAIPIIEAVKDMIEFFEVRTGTLDDAFLTITGGSER
ncbi:MAG: ATP-binding cassette domain-containing protein [Candidatus Methanomethylophilaceae archaeon]|nr:ATP-binding cassette domain-containing protein [Candidatus Methanomethylophilaceae archaeon]